MRRNILDRVSVREFYCLDQSWSAKAVLQLPCALLDYVMDNSNVQLAERALTSAGWANEVFDSPAGLITEPEPCTVVQLSSQNQPGWDIIMSQRLVNESNPLIVSLHFKWGGQVDSERGTWLQQIKGKLRLFGFLSS